MQARELSSRLADRAETVAKYLLPHGKRAGHEWKVGSIHGEPGDSLSVCLSGDKRGIFCDFATGEKGDLLDLWKLIRKINLAEAIKEVKQYLGITEVSFTPKSVSNFVKPVLKSAQLAHECDSGHPVKDYLVSERKLTTETLKAFQVGVDGREIIFPFMRDGEIYQAKYLSIDRPNGKKHMRVESNCQPLLFGWQAIPSGIRKIALTEGELDAMSLYQLGIPALSLPFGGGKNGKLNWLEYEFDHLSQFDLIYLCLDQDEVGQLTAMELVERLGRHRCYLVSLPCKDANECLQQGITSDDMKSLFDQAKSFDPVELKSASLFAEAVIESFYPSPDACLGYLPPWEKANRYITFRPNELSIWTGINGHGKSQFLGHLILSFMQQGAKVCIASLEIKPERLLMRLTRQAAALERPTTEYIQAIHNWYEGKLWIFDLVGTAKAERLLEVFLYARQRYGINVFVIDSFMKCGIAEEDYQEQKKFVEQLCDFKNQHACHIHLIIHPRKSMDESKPPSKLDVKGSGSVTDLADNCFTIWRNKHKEEQLRKHEIDHTSPPADLINYPDCVWICDKQRNGDWEGKVGLWFDAKSYQYLNHSSQKLARFVDYSTIN